MPIELSLKDEPVGDIKLVLKDKNTKKISVAIRKTLDGNLILQDHHSMNVVIMPEKGKIITFPKEEYNDLCYADQDDLFKFLTVAGVVQPNTVNGSNIYGSLEATYQKEKLGEEEPLEVVILNVHNFLNKHKMDHQINKKYVEDLEDELLNPDDEESTELGEIPQEKFKGSVPIHGFPTRGVYRYNY